MSEKPNQGLKKPYAPPTLRRIKLTEDELAVLRAADDPLALLVKMKPDLLSGE